MAETFDWLKPSPLWQENGRDMLLPAFRDTFRQPQLLAYQSDAFVDDFLAAAASGDPAAFPIAQNEPLVTGDTLKLFQPAHGRYYLICASLCCIQPAFPDRAVRLADNESVFFVLRKCEGGAEYGWISGSNGLAGWQSVNGTAVLTGEERLPLAAVAAGNGRTLVFGYLPVASRETYQALPSQLPGTPVGADARLMELQSRFTQQLAWVDAVQLDDADEEADTALRLSVYMLLDLWEFLLTALPLVGDALLAGDTGDLSGANAALVAFLDDQDLGGSVTLAGALTAVAQARATLNDLGEDPLPSPFLNETSGVYDYTLKGRTLDVAGLEAQVEAALDEADEEQGVQEAPITIPKLRPDTGETFVVRCVYERPQCRERRYWASQPSVTFRMASFYDPDAPVRPVRIPLPDVSMGSLRRFKKGVGFIMSEGLQQKIEGIGGDQISLLDRPLLELGLGYLCTFSLPIITLCAFILLLVMVIVLNLVFWWIPFFKICLPVPKLD